MSMEFQMEEANVFKETKQFTYKDGSQFVFMDLVYIMIQGFPHVSNVAGY